MAEIKFEVYKLTFEHSDREATIAWQRNNGFLIANSAFLIVVGLFRDAHLVAIILSSLAFAMSLLWAHQNHYSSAWHRYWIREMRRLEEEIDECKIWTRASSKAGIEQGRPSVRFTTHSTWLANLIAVAWFSIVVFFGGLSMGWWLAL